MDSKDVDPYQVVEVVELCQVVNVPNPSKLIFNLHIKISDFNNEGFPAAALTFMDHLDRKAFQITFTPDKNYKPGADDYLYQIRNGFIENITISLLEYAREKKIPLNTYNRARKAKISFYIAGPSSSRCTECVIQIYHVSLIAR